MPSALADAGVSQPSFEELYDEHHVRAYRLALLLCAGEAVLAEDVVSEAFAQAYPRWLAGGVVDFGPYLRRAVANQVKGVFRHRRLERREGERLGADDRGVLPFDERFDRRDELWQALGRLPPKQRTAIVLFYYDDRPIEEVANVMQTAAGTVKAHLSRGRERLRQLLGEEGER